MPKGDWSACGCRHLQSHSVESAPQTGDRLEDFTLPNYLGEMQSLAVLREHGPVVVTFYRGG